MKPLKFSIMKDAITVEEQNQLNQDLAEFIFSSGLPPYLVSYPKFRSFLASLRPAYRVPSRSLLESRLKPELLSTLDIKVNEIKEKSKFIMLSSDGWSSRKRDHFVTTVGLFQPSKIPLFISGKVLGIEREDTAFLVQYMTDQIENVGASKVCGFVTDNASAFKSAKTTLQILYPAIFFGGCVCHHLNLLVKSLLKYRSFENTTSGIFSLASAVRKGLNLI